MSLNKGEDFAKVATAFSECPSGNKGGDLGIFSKGKMVKAFEEAAYTLEMDKVSDVVETDHGVHLIKRINLKQASDAHVHGPGCNHHH